MSAPRATFASLPPEIHVRIFSFIEAHYRLTRNIVLWKGEPLPREFTQLAFINQQWRRLVIARKFKCQLFLPRIEDVRELAHLTSGHPLVAASIRDLRIFVTHTELSELWGQISKWAEEGLIFQNLIIASSYGQTSHTQIAGMEEGGEKYALYEFASSSNAETGSSVPITIERLELETSVSNPSAISDEVLQFGSQSMHTLLTTCAYMESIIKLQSQNLENLTTLSLKYPITMSRQPYSTSTRSFYLDEKVDERGDNLSNILRKLSKRLKTVLIDYDTATSEIFEPRDGALSDGEPEDWLHLHTFQLLFRDIDAYGYRRSELRSGVPQNTEAEEEDDEEEEELGLRDGNQEYQDIPTNDNDGFDWLNPDIIDDPVKYKDDRDKRTATSGVRNFFLVAAKAIANKMPGIQSFRMEMMVIGAGILEPKDLPEYEGGESDNELVRIFKEGLGEDVKIRYRLPAKPLDWRPSI
ncbi:hypothetical protein TWF102_003218 [Orbilia oligospora]|uniref:Uncharacterized protein n=1 Tax=Orbilia oligospora TaxID=2813651 RepID=A0A7C8IWP4_ORBOL|nr:hypothetical protein TWF102_003218 [Orbilia oligospora]